MGKNNHNAGMHFVRFGRNVFDPNGYDKYIDIMAEHAMRKTYKKEVAELKKINNQKDETVNKAVKRVETEQDLMDHAYELACEQEDRLYTLLYLCAISNHKDLESISSLVTEYLLKKSNNESIDSTVFLAMTSKMIGMNIGQLASIRDEEIRDMVYSHILLGIDEDFTSYCSHSDDEDYFKATLCLLDYSKEDSIRSYYMYLREAVESNQEGLLPDIYIYYPITFHRTKKNDKNEYSVSIMFMDYEKNNYLNMYEAFVYRETSGKVADFFELTYKK